MSKGFGKQQQPKFWINIVDVEGNESFVPYHKEYHKALEKARDIIRDTQPPVDMVLILKGSADTTSVNGSDVIFRGEPRPFTSALDEKMGWEEVRQVPKYGKIRKPS